MTDRPIGPIVEGWSPASADMALTATRQYCRIAPLEMGHVPALFAAFDADDGTMWDYMPNGPFATEGDLAAWAETAVTSTDPLFHTIMGAGGVPLGFASYLRISPSDGVIEVGFIAMSPALQRTRAATEAMYLMMRHAFERGYRRYEWKCNALNAPSMRAAKRLGFTFEGIFRQATIVKGRNRDTAWYSILDHEWPGQKARFEAWLNPENFTPEGQQIRSLAEL
ncbi:RimJ/RimL family protein N-acetyltransferase [Rubricella aquisinus]|uniref:RimJ/RimL family protein N-acetyltransferase n=1 Tax=Rubricella aquisinus TaxID=2028108 RepID=A0A840X010_9RHOB|nr:GNAT family protein [Rubricella aquisinus]MBB5516740.1 RimJ/RimL family protein N-acetyltransferase [Rubricella aquisinus]